MRTILRWVFYVGLLGGSGFVVLGLGVALAFAAQADTRVQVVIGNMIGLAALGWISFWITAAKMGLPSFATKTITTPEG